MSEFAAMISISGLAHAASAPHANGQINPCWRAFAPMAAGSTPATRRDRPVEAEFAEHRKTRDGVRRDRADGGHQPERDRKIVVAAFLRQVGRRHVHRDATRGKRKARCDQRGAHPLARFGHGLVGKAHDIERGQSGCNLHLHIDGARLNAFERDCRYPLNHAAPLLLYPK
jgi:hypothetical protein